MKKDLLTLVPWLKKSIPKEESGIRSCLQGCGPVRGSFEMMHDCGALF